MFYDEELTDGRNHGMHEDGEESFESGEEEEPEGFEEEEDPYQEN